MQYKKDSEGKDILDENGNPIPEENADDQRDESITPEEIKHLKEALKNVVEEVKELRVKNRELSEKTNPEKQEPKPQDDVKEKVKEVLKEERMSSAEANKMAAFEKFITLNKDFHPDNDISGVKQRALLNKIAERFNTNGIYDEKDFFDVFEEASILLKKGDSSSKTSGIQNPYSSTPVTKITPQKVEDDLSPKEKKLVERGSATKEYILKLRKEKPSYLASLLERVRD